MSGNPFRRNASSNVKLQVEERPASRTPSPFKIGKKEKRVKIQTPPQSPEEVPRRLSAGNISPPPPERESSSEDDSDTTATADSDIEQAVKNTRRNSGSLPPPGTAPEPGAIQSPAVTPGVGAPYNPFARTLASNDARFGLQRSNDGQEESAPPKPEGERKKAMDVDMFKNILMTGSHAPTPPQSQHVPDSSSNTDTSSISKNSLFDQSYNLHPESPRSSFDYTNHSDDEGGEDEQGGLMGANKQRLDDFAPPAPPKPGQAKVPRGPQTVAFADFDDSSPTDERAPSSAQASPAHPVLAGRHQLPELHRTASDLNKPLPKTPPRSPGLPRETPLSIDTQTSQHAQPPTPTVISPNETVKKAPPPPPASRRAAQPGTPQTRVRSSSNATQESTQEPSSPHPRPSEDSVAKHAAPPPPPSRKSKPASYMSTPAVGTLVSEVPSHTSPAPAESDTRPMQPPPAPAPRRNPSTKVASSVHRSPSNASHNSIPRSETSVVPPAPPPRRAGGSKRESLDGAAGSMSWAQRRSSQNSFESARSTSLSKPTLPSEAEELPQGESSGPLTNDILADMSAFQAEIEALRKQAEKGG